MCAVGVCAAWPHILGSGGRVDCDAALRTSVGVHDSLGLPATLEDEIIAMATIHYTWDGCLHSQDKQ